MSLVLGNKPFYDHNVLAGLNTTSGLVRCSDKHAEAGGPALPPHYGS